MTPSPAGVVLLTERVAAGGDSVAREPSGRVVFVRGALPGERVLTRITEEKRTYARGEVIEVEEPSPGRRSPPCPFVAAGCGGCGWQHASEDLQQEMKRTIVAEALTRVGRVTDPQVEPGPALDPFGFRTTLRLGVDASGRLGFREHHSHRVVRVDPCLVAHPLLADLVADGRFPGATDVTLRVGVGTGERVAVVDPPGAGASALVSDDVVVGPPAAYHELVAGARLRVSDHSFFQSRHDGAEALVGLVREVIGDAAGAMVDAYGGVGLFAAALGAERDVTVVESSRSACGDAEANLAGRGATVVRCDVARWRPSPAAVVVADPPRTGLGAGAAGRLAETGAEVLALVSCDPVSLARDAALLAGLGYDHVRSILVDLFPQTPRIEAVTHFRRR